MTLYTITDVCRRSGISAHTLRHYERRGLLTPAEIDRRGHRLYGTAELAVIAELRIRAARGQYLRGRSASRDLEAACRQLLEHLDAVERDSARLRLQVERIVTTGMAGMSDDDILDLLRAVGAWSR